MLNFIWIIPIAFILSIVLTGLLRRYALAVSLLDIPNERSSHVLPTPRGGGLAMVAVFLSGLVVLKYLDLIAVKSFWAVFGAGAWIALVGFIDDHRHIPARWRLMAHFIGALWGLYWLGGMPSLIFLGFNLNFGWLGYILGLLYLTWLLNLFNFMDGIDGIAGIEAITVCIGGIILSVFNSSENETAILLIVLLTTVSGFLYWNFPPAKIFMGDVGSGFLGIILGLASLQSTLQSAAFFWSWLILLGVFIVDATFTLIRRLLSGEKVYQAHCSHAYQIAARRFNGHKPVSLAIAVINVLWLMPIALWAGLGGLDGMLAVIVAYTPLLVLAIFFKAGSKAL